VTITWLPYGGAQPSGAVRSLPLPVQPPAQSSGPAVAIPCLLALAVIGATLWARQLGPSSAVGEHLPKSNEPTALRSLPESVQRWGTDIDRWAAEYGVAPEMVAVVMTLESCGAPRAQSAAGAIGLFQVMPFHFGEGEKPFDPQVNARRGLAYLRRGLDLAGGDPRLALAGYNGGHGLIYQNPASWPAETQRYVTWGTGILADLEAGRSPSPALNSWLAAGGESLCRLAAATSS